MKKFLLFMLLALGAAQASAYIADTTVRECHRRDGIAHTHWSGRVSCHGEAY
jgi:hypothetical protein